MTAAIGLVPAITVGFALAVLLLPGTFPVKTATQPEHTVLGRIHARRRSPLNKLQTRLERMEAGITAYHYLLITGFAGSICYVLAARFLQSWWLALPFSVIGLLLIERVMGMVQYRRRERFEAENVKALRIMASALRTTPSYLHAFEQAASSPFLDKRTRAEYRRVVEMLQGKMPLEVVLREFAKRTGSSDVSYLATILLVQRDLGGDMAKSLEQAAHMILRRAQTKRRGRSVLSQLMAQVHLLTVMPFVFLGALYLNNPRHFEPLTETFTGRLLFAGSLLVILMGGELIRYLAAKQQH